MEKINYQWNVKNRDSEKENYLSVLTLDFFDPEKEIEKKWKERTGLNHRTLCAAIETIVFMSEKPISLLRIKKVLDESIPVKTIHEAIIKLQQRYETSIHGLRLQEVAEGFQFRTKAIYSRFVQSFFNAKTLHLSPSALEVLAIIAYRQPVSKTEIDSIRGVDSSHLTRGLMDKRLVKIDGRSQDLGRPSLYSTTGEFLEVFNLAGLGDLPPESDLEEMALNTGVGEISDIKSIVSGDKKKFIHDEMEELKELSQSIKNISPETDFTKMLKAEKKKEKEAVEGRTAFELLEEYVAREETIEQNKLSLESQPIYDFDEVNLLSALNLSDLFAPKDELPKERNEAIDEVLALGKAEGLVDDFDGEGDTDWLDEKLEEVERQSEHTISELAKNPEAEL